ncbi:arsenate reductase ArsC [Phenylobacterium sp.]|uniref:arsenate reductase ArsC n=1 Tax=Phenylobacterium sp. TaxID=1871053 RepID=UPI00120D296F|nr:arsenate reductase ArsC [Phenylobacterium sp.]THD62969.1 MAG: arsenate reductase ArsC [Phenylobacterium sp.]
MSARPMNVLFLCAGNSARSILAEALLTRLGAGQFKAHSAGSFPAGFVNPNTFTIIESLGLDPKDFRSKSWDEFAGPDAPPFDFIFTVCDNAAGEVCPIWPGRPITAHWGVPDPATVMGTPDEITTAFGNTARLLKNRIGLFVDLPFDRLDETSLRSHLTYIGKSAEQLA